LSEDAFDYALSGYEYLKAQGKLTNDDVLTIADFSLPSSQKRLFVIDLKNEKILFNTYVAHGRNSGKETANSFSNDPESFKSSLGFYVTKNTYTGTHGFSLRLEGEEKGINDNAMSRAIVMHSADYVNKSLINSQGYIGRSLGCPALPKEVYKPIIQKIKDGSCLFIYSSESNYLAKSSLLQKANLLLASNNLNSGADSLL
ncbi:MAG: murein L,D-transpeptidase catalytic domain family protein, partial [Ginsengibacter sp.]